MPRSKVLALASLLCACTAHDLAAPNPLPEVQTDKYADIAVTRKVDILFVIDNSGSMKQEQENLARNFPAFVDELRRIKGGLPDVHIGVVTTNLGAGPGGVPGCEGGGQGGLFQGWDRGCGLDPNSRFLVASDGEKIRNYQGDLAAVFGCMAKVGTGGCGYEHQLAATTRALSPQLAPQNAGFLRDDAYLQIVLITDEDDCSASADSDLFMVSFPEEEASFRCARAGHVCQGQMPPAQSFAAPLAACQPVENGALTNVRTFIDQIRVLKRDPSKILVSGIFGWPTSGAGEYKVGKAIDPLTMREGKWDYLPTCSSGNGDATAALRVKQFVDAFGDNSFFASICSGDFRPVLTKMGEKLAKVIGDEPICIDAPLVDTRPETGVQPECLISESLATSDSQDKTYLPRCSPEVSKVCWNLVPGPQCVSGWAVKIERQATTLKQDTRLAIQCRTCAKADDSRCQP